MCVQKVGVGIFDQNVHARARVLTRSLTQNGWADIPCMYPEQSESQQKREMTPEDSDLDRKRRETEALLQSIGISPEPPLGT